MAVPFGVVYLALKSGVAGKPLRMNASETTSPGDGCVKDGELLYPAYPNLEEFVAAASYSRFKCLNLTSGMERNSEIVIPGEYCIPFSVQDELFAISFFATFRIVDGSIEKPVALPRTTPTFDRLLFVDDGRLASVEEADDGGFQLVHLIDGQWTKGRKVLFPGRHHAWQDNQDTGESGLVAYPLQSSTAAARVKRAHRIFLYVSQHEQTKHVVLVGDDGLVAYRRGFEFEDGRTDAVSALTPDNSLREFAGWEQIPNLAEKEFISMTGSDESGLIVAVLNPERPGRVIRRDVNGQWTRIEGFDDLELFGVLNLKFDLRDNNAYIVDSDEMWGFAAIYRIDGNSILPKPLIVWGCVFEYLARWRRLFGGLLLAWWIHLGILIVGTQLVMFGSSDDRYEFGIRHARLASLWRRAFAFVVDTLLLLSILTIFLYSLIVKFDIAWKPVDYKDLCRLLWSFEEAMNGPLSGGSIGPSRSVNTTFVSRCLDHLGSHSEVFTIFLAMSLIFCVLKVYLEGRFGITPGKWLLGIRTVSSTLRSCGFSRALLRNSLYFVDVFLLITPIPGLISILTSQERQRIGDRFADSIVVNAGSIRESEHRPS